MLVIELQVFRDEEGYLITDYHLIRHPLPNLIDENSTTAKVVHQVGKVLGTTGQVTFGFHFILTSLMALSLKWLLSVVKNM